MASILMGPALSFRGLKKRMWRVTAIIAVPNADAPPVLRVEGKGRSEPMELVRGEANKILRYDLSVTLAKDERRVEYGFDDQNWEFTVPGTSTPPRIAYVSCNGFSEPDAVRNAKKPLFAVWRDLLCNHDIKFRPTDYTVDKEQRWHEARSHGKGLQRFHLLVMGGDQIYFDSIWSERERLSELSEWTELSFEEQIKFTPSDGLKQAIRGYYERLYVDRWRARRDPLWGKPKSDDRTSAAAMAAMPTIMMWDDHDIFDGWGSYPPALQYSPLFMHLFDEARRAFWIFQLQQAERDLPVLHDKVLEGGADIDAPVLEPIAWGPLRNEDDLCLPFFDKQPGFSFRFDLGKVSLLALDLRSERSQTQILGNASWNVLQEQLLVIPKGTEHVLLMSSVPVAYPKLGLADSLLGIAGSLGIGKGSPDVIEGLADDLNDHWTHNSHEGELKRFIRASISAAQKHDVRVTILSGDVHVASWGTIVRKDVTPFANWMRINQLTSSSVVHPPPSGLSEELFLMYVSRIAKTDQNIDTDYMISMMKFPESDDYLQAARNWLAVELDDELFGSTGKRCLWATWRCERDTYFSNHLNAIHPVASQKKAVA